MNSILLPRRDLILPARFRQRGFIINPFVFAAAGNGYLDGLSPQPRSVVWLGKKISTATQCIRIRRASDNAEQDIGFSGDSVDSTAATTFTGASDGFLVTGYDQTGNGENWTHPGGASTQPKVINAGSWIGAIRYDGSNDYSMIAALALGAPQCAVFCRFLKASYASTEIIWEQSTNYNSQSNPDAIVAYADGSNFNAGHANTNGWTPSNTAADKLWTVIHDKSLNGIPECKAWENGTTPSQSSSHTNSTDTDNFGTAFDFYIASRAGSSLFSDQDVKGMAIYNSDPTSIRASIEALLT